LAENCHGTSGKHPLSNNLLENALRKEMSSV